MKRSGGLGAILAVVGAASVLGGCGGEPAETPGARSATLIGRVMLAPDVPCSGCSVDLPATGLSRLCNAAGEYRITGVPAGQYALTASAVESGDVPSRTFQVGASAGVISNLETIVLGKAGRIGGRILNAELADLTLAIVGIDGTGVVTAPSDRRAYLLQGVPPGVHDVTLVTEMGVVVRRGVLVLPDRTTTGIDLDLAMVKAAMGSLEGTAVRAEDGPGGSAGLGVELRSALTGQLIGTAVKTSADGSFSLPVPRQGAYAVRATSGTRNATLGGVLFAGGQQRLLTRLVIPLADDLDADGRGNAEDDDDDGDGVLDAMDAFDDDGTESVDADSDGLGDDIDLATKGNPGIDVQNPTPDTDNDGKFDFEDNCVMRPNPVQEDVDADGHGDACDNCPRTSNPDQRDGDMDDIGDACPPSTITCASRGARCGEISDGAGGSIDCGECPMGQGCGAGGLANQCGATTCPTPAVCTGRCGTIPDGCGGTLSCGGCSATSICGAAGICMPCPGLVSCAADQCGSIADGCGTGGRLLCAAVCPGPQTCGGGGTPNRCGIGMNLVQVGAGGGQMGFPGQRLGPVVVQVTRSGMPIMGAAVTVVPRETGASLIGTGLVTSSAGQVSFTPILGRVPQEYHWDVVVTEPDAGGGSTEVTATATPTVGAAAGTVVPVVNEAQQGGPTPDLTGPASQARPSNEIYDIEVASDGTVYFSDNAFSSVYAVSPVGVVRRIAGNGAPGFSGDLGPATAAQLNQPKDIALDEARSRLYIADGGNSRIRVVDLVSGIIETYAGNGASSMLAPYGDDGPASSASLDGNATQLQLDSDGSLYLSDRNVIRRIEFGTGTIRTVISSDNCASNNQRISSCSVERCRFARDSAGRLFVAGALCTGNFQARQGIVRVEADGKQVAIAGGDATPVSGDPALGSSLPGIRGLAFDRAGQLFFSTASHEVWRIDRVGRMFLVSGGGSSGGGGDFGPASAARWSSPRGLAMHGDDLYVVDSGNASIRMIGAAGAASQPVMIAVAGGNMQMAPLGGALPGPLDVRISEGATVLPRVTVGVRARQPGAAVATPTSVSNVAGVASAFVRTSLTPGLHEYEVSLLDIHGADVSGSPARFMAMASMPATGTTFYAINSERAQGDQSAGPGTRLRINSPRGVVVASDGTVYVADQNLFAVLAMDATGLVRVVAGVPTLSGYGGEYVAAVAARLTTPDSLALDETRGLLYVSDYAGDRVRAIEIGGSMGRIYTVAGGGSAGPPFFGDGGPATLATVSRPTSLALDPDGTLWIWESERGALRRLDVGGTISTVDVGYRSTRPLAPDCYTHRDGCRLAVAGGRLLMSATINNVAQPYNGIIEIDRITGVTSAFAGAPAGTTSDGTRRTAVFAQAGELAGDAAGNLVVTDAVGGTMYRIAPDPAATISPLFGSGALGSAGDYVAATTASVGSFARPAFVAGGPVWFSDPDNHALRVIW